MKRGYTFHKRTSSALTDTPGLAQTPIQMKGVRKNKVISTHRENLSQSKVQTDSILE